MIEKSQNCRIEEAMRLDALERQQITDTPRDEAFDRVVRLACATLSAPIGAITFIESERQWIKAEQGLGMQETSRDTSFCTHALSGDEVLVVEDATCDPRFAGNPLVTSQDGIRFYAGAPLNTKEGYTLGTLCVVDHIARKITPRDRALLQDMAAIVVSEMELRRRVGTDALTGLYTRRFFDELGTREIIRARREGVPLTAAFIDADKFKTTNDTYGHPADDAVLRAIGPACRRALRTSDIFARYGGEELVLLLPGANLEQSMSVLERMRQDVEAMVIPELKGRTVTVSIGAAELNETDLTVADLLGRADAALYKAKDAGRNRVALMRAA